MEIIIKFNYLQLYIILVWSFQNKTKSVEKVGGFSTFEFTKQITNLQRKKTMGKNLLG